MESALTITEAASGSDPDTGLRAVAALRALTERLEILQVDNARRLGWSWQQIAARLGHPYLGGEHLLLALAAATQPAGAVLREHGVTPERAEAEIARLPAGGLFGDLDRDALAAVGVDIDAVRATSEASFGQDALTRAAQAVHRKPRRFSPRPAAFTGRDGAFLPLGPGAGQALQRARREAQARGATRPSRAEDLALGILAVSEGLLPQVLSALGVSGPTLSTAVQDRYRQAS